MKRPKNLTAVILAGLHLAFCAVFFTIYFLSKDPQRAIAFVLFLPVDPWILPLGYVIQSEAAIAALVTVFGTAQWWGIGWLLGEVSERFRRRTSKTTSLGPG